MKNHYTAISSIVAGICILSTGCTLPIKLYSKKHVDLVQEVRPGLSEFELVRLARKPDEKVSLSQFVDGLDNTQEYINDPGATGGQQHSSYRAFVLSMRATSGPVNNWFSSGAPVTLTEDQFSKITLYRYDESKHFSKPLGWWRSYMFGFVDGKLAEAWYIQPWRPDLYQSK